MLYVIMSVYKNDTVEDLKIAIDSILAQTYKDFKLYIKRDGQVPDKLDNYLNSISDQRVAIRKRESNMGLAISLNELLDEVLLLDDCEFIARMDADDYSLPVRFEKQVKYLTQHTDVDILGSYITESNDPLDPKGNLVKYPIDHLGCRNKFGKRHPLAHPTVMFRKRYFEKAGLYPTDTLRDEDGSLWLNGFLNGCIFANLPEVLVRMRVTSDFYNRRNSNEKTKQDYLNRVRIIKALNLPKINYLYAYIRYILFRFSPSFLLELAYKLR